MEEERSEKSASGHKWLKIIVFLILAGVFGWGIQAFNTWRSERNNPQLKAEKEAKDVIAKISGIMELPTGEQPAIATVLDKTKFGSDPFFSKAENGDKILIYTQGRKAILYRPSTNMIIDVAPFVLPTPAKR